jgi:hypothetical protein
MRIASRVLAVAFIATAAHADIPGRNPSIVITTGGATHIIYVDPDGYVAHQLSTSKQSTRISHAKADLHGENTPLAAALPQGGLLVVYPVAKQGLFAQRSRDDGRTWSEPVRIDGDAVAARSHNFADLTVAKNGDATVAWLDSREGKQGLITTVLRANGTVEPSKTFDPKACQCCRSALLTSSDGTRWLAWRDLAEGNIRNIAYATNMKPRGDVHDDHWSVNGCPDSGPTMTEASDGSVWIAWFNGRANAVEVASARRDAPFAFRGAIAQGNHPSIGTFADGRLIVVYETVRDGRRMIEARTSKPPYQTWTAPVGISTNGTFPRFARAGSKAVVAYTAGDHIAIVEAAQ